MGCLLSFLLSEVVPSFFLFSFLLYWTLFGVLRSQNAWGPGGWRHTSLNEPTKTTNMFAFCLISFFFISPFYVSFLKCSLLLFTVSVCVSLYMSLLHRSLCLRLCVHVCVSVCGFVLLGSVFVYLSYVYILKMFTSPSASIFRQLLAQSENLSRCLSRSLITLDVSSHTVQATGSNTFDKSATLAMARSSCLMWFHLSHCFRQLRKHLCSAVVGFSIPVFPSELRVLITGAAYQRNAHHFQRWCKLSIIHVCFAQLSDSHRQLGLCLYLWRHLYIFISIFRIILIFSCENLSFGLSLSVSISMSTSLSFSHCYLIHVFHFPPYIFSFPLFAFSLCFILCSVCPIVHAECACVSMNVCLCSCVRSCVFVCVCSCACSDTCQNKKKDDHGTCKCVGTKPSLLKTRLVRTHYRVSSFSPGWICAIHFSRNPSSSSGVCAVILPSSCVVGFSNSFKWHGSCSSGFVRAFGVHLFVAAHRDTHSTNVYASQQVHIDFLSNFEPWFRARWSSSSVDSALQLQRAAMTKQGTRDGTTKGLSAENLPCVSACLSLCPCVCGSIPRFITVVSALRDLSDALE